MRDAVHHDFERNRDLLLHFFRGAARPLRDDLHIVVGDVRIGFDGQIVERDPAPDEQQNRERQHQEAVIEREIDQTVRIIYCSAVFWKTRAFERLLAGRA